MGGFEPGTDLEDPRQFGLRTSLTPSATCPRTSFTLFPPMLRAVRVGLIEIKADWCISAQRHGGHVQRAASATLDDETAVWAVLVETAEGNCAPADTPGVVAVRRELDMLVA